MILTEPIGFDAVEKLIAEKKIKVTDLSSAQIAKLRDEFNIRGNFSARTLSAQLLGAYQDQLKAMGSGQMDMATARLHIKDMIDELEIEPPSEEEAGTITDLGSNVRIGLKLKTDLEMARGKGQYDEGMTEGALQAFPALELIRVEDRHEPREWFELWDEARAALGDETRATSADETGLMIAAKGDPIWLEISDFNQPWPPFKFNSGMGVEDVDYQEAVEQDVIDEDEIPAQPEAMDFNEGVESSVAELAPELVSVLADSLQGIAKQIGSAFQILTKPAAKKPKTISNSRSRIDMALELLEAA